MNPQFRLLRYILLLAVLISFWLAMGDFDPRHESYANVLAQSVNGRPFVVLAQNDDRTADNDSFSVFTPANGELTGWKPALETHSGQVLGVFETPGSAASDKAKEQPGKLGFFFDKGIVTFAVQGEGLNPEGERKSLSFEWLAETAATLNGTVYAFGGELPKDPEDLARIPTTLRVARYENDSFAELKDKGPEFETGSSVMANKVGFWLKAVTVGNRIAVLWRDMRLTQEVSEKLEGERFSATGAIGLSFFDGAKFTPPVYAKGLPKGNVSVWSDNGKLKLLVQTSSAPSDATQGRMEIWTVSADGSAALSETIPSEHRAAGLFPFIQAAHFTYGGGEVILRSTWQNFELWRRAGDGPWAAVENGTTGLPTFFLEHKLWAALGFAAALVLFGGLLAVSRRRQAVLLLQKLKPSDLNAPLASRAGAFCLDFTMVTALTLAVVRIYPQTYDDWIWMVVPYRPPALACFLLYFLLSEWLYGATPGKFVMGLRVVTYTGGKPSLWAALVRNVVGLWERQPFMSIVVLPMMIFNPRCQRMGDLLARTVVVQKQSLDLFLAQRDATPNGATGPGGGKSDTPGDPPANVPF